MIPEKLQKLFDYIHLSYDDEWDPDDIERSQNGDIWFDSQRDAYQSGLHDGEKEFAERLDSLATEAEEEVKSLIQEIERLEKENLEYRITRTG